MLKFDIPSNAGTQTYQKLLLNTDSPVFIGPPCTIKKFNMHGHYKSMMMMTDHNHAYWHYLTFSIYNSSQFSHFPETTITIHKRNDRHISYKWLHPF